MIRVNQLISRAKVGRCNKSKIERIAEATIAATDLSRSIAFYARVFGFRVVGRTGAPVAMKGPGHTHLSIHEYGHEYGNAAVAPTPIYRQWGFVVDDLETVRDAVWDLGVTVAQDSGEPDQIFRWSNGRSLYIHDPDENEIELIEECRNPGRIADYRNCASSSGAWRRRARPGCTAAR